MARRKQAPINDDSMLLEDDFGAAFLDDAMELEGGESLEQEAETPVEETVIVEEEVVEVGENEAELPVDLYETEDKLILKARIAGVDKNDIDLEFDLAEGVVTVSGVLSSNDSEEITQYHLQECYWGKFYRKVKLPVPVKDGDEFIDAVLDEGVLILTFVKEKTDTAKKIKIS